LPAQCPAPLARCLRAFGRRRLRHRCLSAVLGAGAAALLVLLLGLLLDRLADVGPVVRALPLTLFGLALAWGLVRTAAAALSARAAAERLAGEVDRLSGKPGDALRSAVNFLLRLEAGDRPGHEFLVARSVEDAASAAGASDLSRLHSAGPVWRRGVTMALLGAGLIALAWHPGMQLRLVLKRFFDPFGNYPRPSWTHIVTDAPPVARLEAGSDLVVRATLEGRVPESAECNLVLSPVARGGVRSEHAMQPMPDGSFRGLFRNVREDFHFVIEAGDGRTARREVVVLHPPKVTAMTAQYRPPRYSRLKSRTEAVRYREIRALSGTAASIEFTTDRPVAEAFVTLEMGVAAASAGPPPLGAVDPERAPAENRLKKIIDKHKPQEKPTAIVKRVPVLLEPSRTGGTFHFRLEQSGVLRLNLAGENGVSNRFAPSYKVTVIPDNLPTVSITNLPGEISVRADEVLRVSFHARDDLGIADLQYTVSTENRWEKLTEFVPLEKFGAKEAEGEFAVPVREIAPESIYTPAGGQQDATLDFSLGAVDLKGQAAYSRRVRITVLRDTYDRQLTELLVVLTAIEEASGRALKEISSAVNALTVLLESVGPEAKWSDAHQKKLAEITRRMRFRMFDSHDQWRRHEEYRYSLYPYRAQRAADALMMLVPFQGGDYAGLTALGTTPEGRKRLPDALATLREKREFVRNLHEATRVTVRTLRFDMILYLVELSRGELAAFSDADEEFAELFRERQAARAARIVALMRAVGLAEGSDELKTAAEELQKAASEYDLEAIGGTLAALHGHLARPEVASAASNEVLEALLRRHGDAWMLEQGQREARCGLGDALGRVQAAWCDALLVGGDAQITDEPLLAGRAMALLRLFSGVQAPAELLGPISAMRAASQAHTLAAHVGQACEEARALVDALDAGSLAPADPGAELAWGRLRDVLLVLTDVGASGGLDALSADAQRVAADLSPYRPLVLRWDLAGIWADAADRARLRELVRLLEGARPRAMAERARLWPKADALLKEACALLAQRFDAERQDGLRRIAALKEEAKLPPTKHDEEKRESIANWRFGAQKEITLSRYAAIHRKLYDLWEVGVIADGTVAPDVVAQHAAMVHYMWWLISEVTLSFGRYHGPSVVRRHDETADAYLVRMKDYPDQLTLAANAFRHLAATPGAATPHVEAMVKASASSLDLKHEGAGLAAFLEATATLRGAPDATAPAAALADAARQRTPGAFVAERAVIPLRGIVAVLQPEGWSRQRAQAVLKDEAAARDVTRCVEDLPERDETIAFLDLVRSAVDAQKDALNEDDRQELLTVGGRCIESLMPRLQLPAFAPRTSKRLEEEARLNDRIFHCRERTHRLWQLELLRQTRHYERERVDLLLAKAASGADGGAWRALALQYAHVRVAQRKSQGVQREAGGALDVVIPGVRFDLLAMPKHLYEELMRAQNEPYPEQFKPPSLDYLRGLIEDARR